MQYRNRGSESGQILIIIAMGIFLVMLGGTAMAVDWGNGLLQRQRLQNTADAAALAAATELARGGSVDDAVTAAQAIVSSNTAGAMTLPYPGTGSGTGLSEGIEISTTPTNSVRVSLLRQVKTMFAPAIGVDSLSVRAKARAVVGPFGVLPIAFKRFSDGNTALPLTPPDNPDRVTDYLMPAKNALGQAITIDNWPWPSLTTPPSPAASDTADGHYDPQLSGVVAPLVGHDAQANVSNSSDFHFFVAPDVRGLSLVAPVFYNGASLSTTQSAQGLKNTTVGYILAGGYPGPNPTVGEELAAFSGVTNNDVVHAMQQRYKSGDLVTAMVYNGTVYRKPSFDLYVTPGLANTTNLPPVTVSYQVTLMPVNNFTHGGVEFSATGLQGWGDWEFEDGGLNTTYTRAVSGSSPVTVTLKVTANQPGAKTALIQAYAPPPVGSSGGQGRTVCATVVVGTDPSFSVRVPEGRKTVEQGSGTRFDLEVRGWNGIATMDAPVVWEWIGTPPSGVTVTAPATVSVRSNQTGLRVEVDASTAASIGEWPLRVIVKDADPNHQERNQEILLTVVVTDSTASPHVLLNTAFVKVLGYANFRIDHFTNNTVYAHAVSGLASSPEGLGKGMSARLVPWN
ncbi:MAG: pilus assembly protein TadG-related protein [Chloroflexota bacterium]